MAAATAWPGHRGGALPDDQHPVDRPLRPGRAARAGGMVSSPTRTASRPSAPAAIRPRRVLRNDAGRLGQLLEEEVVKVAPGRCLSW